MIGHGNVLSASFFYLASFSLPASFWLLLVFIPSDLRRIPWFWCYLPCGAFCLLLALVQVGQMMLCIEWETLILRTSFLSLQTSKKDENSWGNGYRVALFGCWGLSTALYPLCSEFCSSSSATAASSHLQFSRADGNGCEWGWRWTWGVQRWLCVISGTKWTWGGSAMARLAICGCKLYCLSLMSETGSAFPVCCSGGYPPGLRTSVCACS